MSKYNKQFYNKQQAGSISSANIIVPLIMDIFHLTSVIDIGCGMGTWLNVFKEKGVQKCTGIDSHNMNAAMPAHIEYHNIDLNDIKTNTYAQFDKSVKWGVAISLETAEHLKPENSENFVKVLTKLSDVVIFSAAIPYQGGRNHINEQWQSYWIKLFNDCGYEEFDIIRPLIWSNPDVEWWYAQNIIVFVNKSRLGEDMMLLSRTTMPVEDIVHPRKYIAMSEYTHINFKKWCKATMMLISKLFMSKAQKKKLYYVK